MYGAVRDLFIEGLGYPAQDVVIDTAGDSGRPDVTVRAPSGLIGENGRPRSVDWIVVEAKPKRGTFLDPEERERIFALKAKYITPNTAWFVMVDPQTIVARSTDGPLIIENDLLIDLATADLAVVSTKLHRLRHEEAGVPKSLDRFRAGDEHDRNRKTCNTRRCRLQNRSQDTFSAEAIYRYSS